MAETQNALRNIGILAHVDAGKTTLSERILYFCQAISRMGEVSEGTTVLDFMPEEQKRGITIGAACISCTWKDTRINLVDTPGHIDFTYEVDRIVRVIDGAIVVFSAVEGVEPQSEMVWHQADAHKLPRLIFINKVDRREADTMAVVQAIEKRLHVEPVLLTLPLYANDSERSFLGIIDVLSLEALYFDQATFGASYTRKALFGQDLAQAQVCRDELLEKVASADDSFLEAWVDGNWNTKDLLCALARATKAGKLVPVYAGSARQNTGIQCLLDGVRALLPAPQIPQAPQISQEKSSRCVAFVFKVVFHGDLRVAWLRLYSGRLDNGALLTTSSQPKTEARTRLYRIDAEQILAVDQAFAGDIVAVAGLKAQTGDTVTTNGLSTVLDPLPRRTPVLFQTIEPENAAAFGPLLAALERYQVEDPSLSVEPTESGTYMLAGMGELHLAVILERLKREYNICVKAQTPSVVVRESIAKACEATVAIQSRAETSLGTLSVTVTPRPRGAGNSIKLACGDEQKTTIAKAIARILDRGLNFGPLIDTEVALTSLSASPEELASLATDPLPLDRATEEAVRQALAQAEPLRLEPIMSLAVTCAPEVLGNCVHELERVHATIVAIDDNNQLKIVRAEAALADIRELSTSLRSAARGRASLLTAFVRFDTKSRW